MVVAGVYLGSVYSLKESSIDDRMQSAVSNQVVSKRLDSDSDSFVGALLSGYDSWNVVKKVAFIPVATTIQYITPFNVYNFSNSFNYPYFLVSRNYHVIWLLYIGPLFLFSVYRFLTGRSRFTILLKRITILGLLLYALPAFIYGGAIPRYAVPFYPLLVPLISSTLFQIRFGTRVKAIWRKFQLLYFSLASIAFIVYLIFKAV